MTPDRWKRIDQILEAVFDLDSRQRREYIATHCKDEPSLRREVERLVAAHEQATEFIELPPAEEVASIFADAEELLVGRSLLHYTVLSPLGAGGMGQVYLARDSRLGRRVALKLLPGRSISDKEKVRRFQLEASAASALNHPNILTIYEVGQHAEVHFIATEYIEGITLRERIRRGPVPITEALELAAQITGALAAAHAAGIVHRDVKPENVMIRPDGLVKVLDFGLAKLTPGLAMGGDSGSSSEPSIQTDPGIVMGTVHYMSPEQARAKPLDPRSDVFSTGVLIYEMIAGTRPFEGDSPTDVLVAILDRQPPPLRSFVPAIPSELERIVDRALAKNRELRPVNAGELLSEINKLRRELEVASSQRQVSCPSCGGSNPPDFGFCSHCGSALRKACTNCGGQVPIDDLFCGLCGHHLTGADPLHPATRTITISDAAPESFAASGAERRRATIIYAIVSGCAAILEKLGPEAADRTIERIKKLVGGVITSYGGVVDRCSGDEVVALFGVPTAYEDDYLRAARATIELRDRMNELSDDIERTLGIPLRVYAGLSSGSVVVRNDEGGKYSVSGDPVQIASRLAARAEAGEILVSTETQRLISQFFKLEARGSVVLDAYSEPVAIHRVLGQTGVQTRLEAAEVSGLTPYVAREPEVARLLTALDTTLADAGQFVTVLGDPGVGKSRLLLEFRNVLQERNVQMLVGRCQPHKRNISYLPFIDVLIDLLKLREVTTAEQMLNTAVTNIRAVDHNLEAYIPIYLHLLSIPNSEYPLPADLKGDDLNLAILEALSALLTLNARRAPAVVVLEDWHWADEGSEGAIKKLVTLLSAYPLMVIVTYRLERAFDWDSADPPTAIHLSPLDESSTTAMIESVLGAKELPEGLLHLLRRRTGGNPFFIEEVCRTLVESGRLRVSGGVARVQGRIAELDLPDTVQAVIRTRLDRLNTDSQRVLRYASVLGREFSLGVLERMLGGRSQLTSSLQILQKQGLIQQLRVLPEHVYRFKNVLTQEVAYDSLLVHQRRALHQAAGEAIETLYKDRIEEQVELLVHHYGRAENWERAIHFGIQSADKAGGLSRFGEALAMLEQAQEWIAKLPTGEEPEGLVASVLLKQERLCETLRLRERQQALIDQLLGMLVPDGDRGLLAEVLVRQGELFTLLQRFEDAERALTEAVSIYRNLENPAGECVALRTIGFLRWQQGRYDDSLESNKRALAIDQAQNDRAAYAQDLTNIASVLRNQGHAREALRYLEQALQIHEEMRRPHLQAYNLHVMGNTYRDLGDAEKAMECYQRANQTGIEHKLPLNRVIVLSSLASLAWENGWVEESLRFNSELIGLTRGVGLKHDLALALATRSQRLLDLERSEEAIPLLREATETFAELGEKEEEARTLSSLAYVQERYSDDPVDSLAIWEKVRSLRREQDDPIGQLEALEGMARVARSQLKKPDLAVEYLRQAFQIASTLGDPAREGDLLNTMGILEWGRGNYGTALDHYRKAHSIFLEAGDRVHVGLMLNSIGVTLAKMGRNGEAASRLQEAVQTHQETGQRLLEGHALAALGDLFAEPGSYDQSLEYYASSLDIRRAIGDLKGEGWMLYQMARVKQLAGDANESINLASSAAQIAAEVGDKQLENICARLHSKPS